MAFNKPQVEVVNDMGSALPVSSDGTSTFLTTPALNESQQGVLARELQELLLTKLNELGDTGLFALDALRQLSSTVDPLLGNQRSTPFSSRTTTSSLSALTTSQCILSQNPMRKGATVFNDSTANLYLILGVKASTTSFTAILVPNAYYEVPYGYTGVIEGLWATAAGSARITEVI